MTIDEYPPFGLPLILQEGDEFDLPETAESDPILTFSEDCTCTHLSSSHGFGGCEGGVDEMCPCLAHWLETA